MKTSKYIFLPVLMFFVSLTLLGQTKGHRKLILSTGDTVLVVKQQSFLTSEDMRFLRKDTLKREAIMDMKSDYNTLEAAALDIDKILGEIGVSQSLSKQNNESLSVRLATRNLRNLKKEQQAKNMWDSIMAKEPTVKELTEFYELFGNKPSYFINGVLVEEQVVNKLRPSEILSRNLRTIDTATGNPNGEIWYEVGEQTLRRLKFQEVDASEIEILRIAPSTGDGIKEEVAEPLPEKQKQEPAKEKEKVIEKKEPLPKYTPRLKVIKKGEEPAK